MDNMYILLILLVVTVIVIYYTSVKSNDKAFTLNEVKSVDITDGKQRYEFLEEHKDVKYKPEHNVDPRLYEPLSEISPELSTPPIDSIDITDELIKGGFYMGSSPGIDDIDLELFLHKANQDNDNVELHIGNTRDDEVPNLDPDPLGWYPDMELISEETIEPSSTLISQDAIPEVATVDKPIITQNQFYTEREFIGMSPPRSMYLSDKLSPEISRVLVNDTVKKVRSSIEECIQKETEQKSVNKAISRGRQIKRR